MNFTKYIMISISASPVSGLLGENGCYFPVRVNIQTSNDRGIISAYAQHESKTALYRADGRIRLG